HDKVVHAVLDHAQQRGRVRRAVVDRQHRLPGEVADRGVRTHLAGRDALPEVMIGDDAVAAVVADQRARLSTLADPLGDVADALIRSARDDWPKAAEERPYSLVHTGRPS